MNELYHYGILGMKWGIRRYQNKDGSLTKDGAKRYQNKDGSLTKELDDAERYRNTIDKDITDTYNKYNKENLNHYAEKARRLSDELYDDYSKLYSKLKKDSKFKQDLFNELYKDFGDGCNDKELFELVVEEKCEDLLAKKNNKTIKNKEKELKESINSYFNEAKMATKDLISKYQNVSLNDLKKGSNDPYYLYGNSIDTIINSKFLKKDQSANFVSYLNRHYEDYWVMDRDDKYDWITSYKMEDYNRYAKNKKET